MRKYKMLMILELLILLALGIHLFSNHGFILVLVIASFLSAISLKMSRGRTIVGFLALFFWLIVAIFVITSGFFWVALIVPIIALVLFFQDKKENDCRTYEGQGMRFAEVIEDEELIKGNFEQEIHSNDLIDLFDMEFHEGLNQLSISKQTGNTKIIVPEDVGIRLDVSTVNGLIEIFGEISENDLSNHAYQSDNYEISDKKINILIRVVSGNIEVVRG